MRIPNFWDIAGSSLEFRTLEATFNANRISALILALESSKGDEKEYLINLIECHFEKLVNNVSDLDREIKDRKELK